jgi:hypothetical protein
MAVVIVSVFLTLWLLLSVIYAFRTRWLGPLANPLHQLGWLNTWTMFVPRQQVKIRYDIYFRNQFNNDTITEWTPVSKSTRGPLAFILNPKLALSTLLKSQVLKLLRLHFNDAKQLDEHPSFVYLCKVICQLKTSGKPVSRQIKITYELEDEKEVDFVQSHFISLI